MHAIDQGDQRFNALTRTLSPATPRALSQGLRGVAETKLFKRELIDDDPLTSLCGLTKTGLILARAA